MLGQLQKVLALFPYLLGEDCRYMGADLCNIDLLVIYIW